MTTMDVLMSKLFKSPRILLVDDNEADSTRISTMIRNVTECYIDRFEGTVDGTYDLVLVDESRANSEILALLKDAGPIVLTSRESKLTVQVVKDCPVTLVAKPVTEQELEDVFKMFKIRARTPEVAACLNELTTSRSTFDKSFVGSQNGTLAV